MSFKGAFGMGGSSSKRTDTTDNSLDPLVAGVLGNVWDRATAFADKPWDPNMVAGVQPLMQSSWDAVQGLGGTGNAWRNQAAQGLMGYQPYQYSPMAQMTPQMGAASAGAVTLSPLFTAGRASTIDPQSMAMATAGTAGMTDRGSIRDVNMGAFGRPQIEALFNPFEDTKVANAIRDYERARQGQRSNDSAQAARAGAWGGSRHGVADSLTNEAFQRTSQSAVNDLRYQGWQSALDGALNVRGQDLQGQMANQQADLGVAGMNAETGRFNTGQFNETSRYNAGQRNSGLFFNADAENQRSEFNANLLGTLSRFNAGEANTWADNEANRTQEANRVNASNMLQALINDSTNSVRAGTAADDINIRGLGLLGDFANDSAASDRANWGLLNQAGQQQQAYEQSIRDSQFGLPLTQLEMLMKAAGLYPAVTDSSSTGTQKGKWWEVTGSAEYKKG